ncbi:hypothetical protein HMPREF0372_00121, partial [Flavonifractor plautii ATCC 29863]
RCPICIVVLQRAYDEYMESSFIGMMGAEDETGEEICTGMMM